MTLKELRDFIKDLLDTDRYGKDYEVWIDNKDGTPSEARTVWKLNSRKDGCDIIFK